MKEKGKIPKDKLIYVDFTKETTLKIMKEWFGDNNMESDELGYYFMTGQVYQALAGKKDIHGKDLCDDLKNLFQSISLAVIWGCHRHPELFKFKLIKKEHPKEERKSYIG